MAKSRRRRAAAVVVGPAVAATVVALGAWSLPLAGSSAVPRPGIATPTVAITTLVDGTAPFSTGDGAGQDSSAANARLRAGDALRLGVRVTPNGDAGTTSDVVVDITSPQALVTWGSAQPKGCVAAGATLTCTLGARPVGTPIDLVVEGRAAERSTQGDVAGTITVGTGGTPAAVGITVTAATPAVDAAVTAPRFAGTTTREGVDGVLVTYGLQLQTDLTTALVSDAAGSTLDLLVDVAAAGPGAEVVACSANGAPAGEHTYSAAVSGSRVEGDVAPAARLVDGGAWSCTPDGQRARVTVTGVDTNPDTPATQAWNQEPLAPGVGAISAGAVTVFVPAATVATEGRAALSVSPVAGTVAGQANHGTCGDVDTLAAGGCGSEQTRQDPLAASAVGDAAPRLTVLHTVDAPVAAEGAPLTWTTLVTNTGNVTLADVSVAVSTDPATAHPAPGPLAPGESFSFTTSGTQPAVALDSTATASGTPAGGPAVSASFTATSTPAVPTALGPVQVATVGADVVAAQTPKTVLKVYVNGIEFEATPGPIAVVGIPNLIEYEIDNPTGSALSNVVVEDGSITNDSTAIDCDEDPTNKNRIPSLAAGDTIVCLRTLQPTTPGNVNLLVTTTVNGTPDASLNAVYQVLSATVDLELAVNGQDADSTPGPSVAVNSLLTFGYTIRNTGTIDLSNVYVSHVDDDEGVYDEISCASLGDDTDGDATIDLMEPGQTVNCTFTPRAVAGAFSTVASVVATPLTADGEELATEDGTLEVTDQDALNYTGVTSGGTSGETGGSTVPVVATQNTTTGTIGNGGANTWILVLSASATFLAGFGLWSLARRRLAPR